MVLEFKNVKIKVRISWESTNSRQRGRAAPIVSGNWDCVAGEAARCGVTGCTTFSAERAASPRPSRVGADVPFAREPSAVRALSAPASGEDFFCRRAARAPPLSLAAAAAVAAAAAAAAAG